MNAEPRAQYADIEIDLYKLGMVLVRGRWFIIITTIVIAAAAFALTRTRPLTYKATATIITRYERPVINLSSEFSTVRDVRYTYDSKTKAFLSIAQGDSLAQTVYDTVRPKIDPSLDARALRSMVDIETQGDAILVMATSEDSVAAAAIANAWAQETVKTINASYGSSQSLETIDAQIEVARIDYDRTQSSFENYLLSDPAKALQRRLEDQEAILEQLRTAQIDAAALYMSTQLSWPLLAAEGHLEGAEYQRSLIADEQTEQSANLLSSHYGYLLHLEKQLGRLDALRDSLGAPAQSSPGQSGEALAMLLAKSSAFGLGGDAIFELTVTDLDGLRGDSSTYAADLDRLVAQVENAIAAQNAEIDRLSESMLRGDSLTDVDVAMSPANPLYVAGMDRLDDLLQLDLTVPLVPEMAETPLGVKIEETAATIQSLQSKLEQASTAKGALIKDRDLARQVYQALLDRRAEIQTAAESTEEVSLASGATPPTKPESRRTLTTTAAAAFSAGFFSCLLLLGRAVWRAAAERASKALIEPESQA